MFGITYKELNLALIVRLTPAELQLVLVKPFRRSYGLTVSGCALAQPQLALSCIEVRLCIDNVCVKLLNNKKAEQ